MSYDEATFRRLVADLAALRRRVEELESLETPAGVDPGGHDHAKLVASDGDPDPAVSVDAAGDLATVGYIKVGASAGTPDPAGIATEASILPGASVAHGILSTHIGAMAINADVNLFPDNGSGLIVVSYQQNYGDYKQYSATFAYSGYGSYNVTLLHDVHSQFSHTKNTAGRVNVYLDGAGLGQTYRVRIQNKMADAGGILSVGAVFIGWVT